MGNDDVVEKEGYYPEGARRTTRIRDGIRISASGVESQLLEPRLSHASRPGASNVPMAMDEAAAKVLLLSLPLGGGDDGNNDNDDAHDENAIRMSPSEKQRVGAFRSLHDTAVARKTRTIRQRFEGSPPTITRGTRWDSKVSTSSRPWPSAGDPLQDQSVSSHDQQSLDQQALSSSNTEVAKRAAAEHARINRVGAMGVFASGVVVLRQPAALTDAPVPEAVSDSIAPSSDPNPLHRNEVSSSVPAGSSQSPNVPASYSNCGNPHHHHRHGNSQHTRPEYTLGEDGSKTFSESKFPFTENQKNVPKGDNPSSLKEMGDESKAFHQKQLFWMITLIILLLIVGIVVGVLVAGGSDDGDSRTGGDQGISGPSLTAPTPTASLDTWDTNRRDTLEYFVVEVFQLTDRNTLRDPQTPQYAAWKWLVNEDEWSIMLVPAESMDPIDTAIMMDRYALAVFYFALNGPDWEYQETSNIITQDFTEWLEGSSSHCEWVYVECDATTMNVTGIHTGGRPGSNIQGGAINMAGAIPSESQQLSGLTTLRIPGNRIYNADALKSNAFPNLRVVDLAGNTMDGAQTLFQFSSINTLSLASAQIGGTLPDLQNMTSLLALSIPINSLTGVVMDQLASHAIRDISLGQNSLAGDIMDVLQGHEETLVNALLEQNRFSGSLSPSIANFTNLSTLNLNRNDLTGTLPSELALLPGITRILLEGNFLVGSLPPEWGSLTRLETLNLRSTYVQGTIPEEWSGMTRLRSLHIESTLLEGTIPASLCALESLKEIRIDERSANFIQCGDGCSKCSQPSF